MGVTALERTFGATGFVRGFLARTVAALAFAGLTSACVQAEGFLCSTDASCAAVGAVCLPDGYCALPNERCESGLSYGANAGDAIGTCVDRGAAETAGGTASGGGNSTAGPTSTAGRDGDGGTTLGVDTGGESSAGSDSRGSGADSDTDTDTEDGGMSSSEGGCDRSIDRDNDGTPDCDDACPDDPEKTAPLDCGCGVPDVDGDMDGVPDCADGCPMDAAKIVPGACGCGAPDTDTDGDMTADCVDNCPADPDKTEPGTCGCGVADTDSDSDGTPDCNDPCPDAAAAGNSCGACQACNAAGQCTAAAANGMSCTGNQSVPCANFIFGETSDAGSRTCWAYSNIVLSGTCDAGSCIDPQPADCAGAAGQGAELVTCSSGCQLGSNCVQGNLASSVSVATECITSMETAGCSDNCSEQGAGAQQTWHNRWCNSQGACAEQTRTECAPYRCYMVDGSNAACYTSCTSGTQCAAFATCDTMTSTCS